MHWEPKPRLSQLWCVPSTCYMNASSMSLSSICSLPLCTENKDKMCHAQCCYKLATDCSPGHVVFSPTYLNSYEWRWNWGSAKSWTYFFCFLKGNNLQLLLLLTTEGFFVLLFLFVCLFVLLLLFKGWRMPKCSSGNNFGLGAPSLPLCGFQGSNWSNLVCAASCFTCWAISQSRNNSTQFTPPRNWALELVSIWFFLLLLVFGFWFALFFSQTGFPCVALDVLHIQAL